MLTDLILEVFLLSTMLNNKIFILIHGAWHASWCWERVAHVLRQHGNRVITPDLPGHGDNVQANVQFSDYISSITRLTKEQRQPVILVGHSMAGYIIAAVAAEVPDCIEALVFLSAYVPAEGQSIFARASTLDSHSLESSLQIDTESDKVVLSNDPELAHLFCNCCSPSDQEEVLQRLQPEPLATFNTPLLVSPHWQKIRKCYMVASQDKILVPRDQKLMAKNFTNTIVIEGDHASYFSAPLKIAQHLMREKTYAHP